MNGVRQTKGFLIILLLMLGCGGPSAEEWQAAQADISKLKADLAAADRRHGDDVQKFTDAQQQIADLEDKLRELGVSVSNAASKEAECEGLLVTCRARDCSTQTAATWSTSPQADGASASSPSSAVVTPTYAPTIPYPGNGGGPTLCADGSVSNSSGRGTCSHHGGISGGRHRKH